jgi:hypothetical protein
MFMMYWWFFTSVFMDKYGQGEANHILLWVSRIIHWIGFREMSLATSLQLFFKVKKTWFPVHVPWNQSHAQSGPH